MNIAADIPPSLAGADELLTAYGRWAADRDEWRAVWPASVQLTHQRAEMWTDYGWTVEGSVQAWAAVAREVQG